MFGDLPAENIEDDKSNQSRQRRVDGTGEGLADGFADNLIEGLPRSSELEIFADAVEDDDSVVDREAENDQKRCHEKRVDFISRQMSEDREHSCRNDDVMDEGNDGD